MMSISDVISVTCDDGSCCCISSRNSVSIISIINLCACTTDILAAVCPRNCCGVCKKLGLLRMITDGMFQIVNVMLLIATVIEKPELIEVYLYSAFAYVLIGLMITLIDFVVNVKNDGPVALVTYVPDVIFLFVVFRCLPLIDDYRTILLKKNAPQPVTQAPQLIDTTPKLDKNVNTNSLM